MQGTLRTKVHNTIVGVTKGYKISLKFVGIGYRIQVKNQKLDLIFQVEPSNPDLVNVNTVQLKVVFPMKDVVQ